MMKLIALYMLILEGLFALICRTAFANLPSGPQCSAALHATSEERDRATGFADPGDSSGTLAEVSTIPISLRELARLRIDIMVAKRSGATGLSLTLAGEYARKLEQARRTNLPIHDLPQIIQELEIELNHATKNDQREAAARSAEKAIGPFKPNRVLNAKPLVVDSFTGASILVRKVFPAVEILDTETGASVVHLDLPQDAQNEIKLSPNLESLLIFRSKNAAIWNTHTNQIRSTLETSVDSMRIGAFSPTSKLVAICNDAGAIVIHDVDTGKVLQKLELNLTDRLRNFFLNRKRGFRFPKSDKSVTRHIIFTPDNQSLIADYSDGMILKWDVSSGKLQTILREPGGSLLYPPRFTGDGQHLLISYIVSPQLYLQFEILDFKSGISHGSIQMSPKKGISAIASNQAGSMIAVVTIGDDDAQRPEPAEVHVWDVKSGSLLSRSNLEGMKGDLLFSPDGGMIITSTDTGVIEERDVSTGYRLQRLNGNPGGASRIHLSQEGDELYLVDSSSITTWRRAQK